MSKKKDKKQAEASEASGAAEAARGVESISIATHPRARVSIRRARTRGALIVFAVVLLLGLKAGQMPFDATWRALIAGIVANVVVWRCAIIVWRHLVLAELRAAEERYAERRRQLHETLTARAAAKSEAVGFRAA
jgi:hypothetical protein